MQAFDTIQAQINQVQLEAKAKIAALQQQAEAARKAALGEVIKDIKRLIAMHQLTAADLGLNRTSKSNPTASDKRAAVAPKYRDQATGQTWTGRGKAPTWLAAKMAAGATKESFKI